MRSALVLRQDIYIGEVPTLVTILMTDPSGFYPPDQLPPMKKPPRREGSRVKRFILAATFGGLLGIVVYLIYPSPIAWVTVPICMVFSLLPDRSRDDSNVMW